MVKRILLMSLLALSTTTFSQGYLPSGSRSMSMANASVTNNDVWGFFNNPGALGDVEDFTVALSYENRFLLKELQTQSIAAAIPLKFGVISVGGHMYGYNQYRSYKGGLGYSMSFTEKIFAGVQLNYQGLQLNENYGSKNTMSAEAGIYAKVTDNWKIGVSVFNVGRTRLSEFEDDRFTTLMKLGTSYTFSKKVIVALEVEKDLDYKPRVKVGIEYQAVDNFFIRGGYASTRSELTFGFGYNFNIIQLDLGTSYDQILGWSPNFSLSFQPKGK